MDYVPAKMHFLGSRTIIRSSIDTLLRHSAFIHKYLPGNTRLCEGGHDNEDLNVILIGSGHVSDGTKGKIK
jgi:hypothetical protein